MIRPAVALLVLTCLLLLARPAAVSKTAVVDEDAVTEANVQAVTLAIQDEIYDEGCQGYGADASAKSDGHSYQLPLYIQRSFNKNGLAWAIYKFLPMGEVLRGFAVDQTGVADLYGHPEWGFPPTEISYRTAYMNDDDLCQLKHDWIRTSFTLELQPSAERLREAEQRQKVRFEGDYRPHKRDCSFDWR